MSSLIHRLFNVILFTGAFCCCIQDYTVPEPIIELLYPRGFSVKIPHSDGMNIFAFHGKINEQMSFLEAGKFSKDICNRTGDFWIFQDRNTRINVGDKIYYWLFVIKNGLGFRYDDGEYTITEKTPYGIDHNSQSPTTTRIPTTTTNPTTDSSITTTAEHTTKLPNDNGPTVPESNTTMTSCESTILNITHSLLELRSEVSSLKDTNEILREIAEKHPASARTLKVEGRIPVNEDALSTVKGIIKQKLALSIEVAEATRNKDGSITFEAASLDHKVQIIKAAKEKLRYSRIYLTY